MKMNRKICFAFMICMISACSGCIFPLGGGHHPAFSDAHTLAMKTLDIRESHPDLVIYAPQKIVFNILRVIGADADFPNKARYWGMFASVYENEGVTSRSDSIILYNDGTEGWMNVILIKEQDGKALLWLRKPTSRSYKPTPDSPFYKDWLSIIMRECAARNLRVER